MKKIVIREIIQFTKEENYILFIIYYIIFIYMYIYRREGNVLVKKTFDPHEQL